MLLARLVPCSVALVIAMISAAGCTPQSKEQPAPQAKPAQSAALPPPTTASVPDEGLSCDPQTPEQIEAKIAPVCYKLLGVPVVGPGHAPK